MLSTLPRSDPAALTPEPLRALAHTPPGLDLHLWELCRTTRRERGSLGRRADRRGARGPGPDILSSDEERRSPATDAEVQNQAECKRSAKRPASAA